MNTLGRRIAFAIYFLAAAGLTVIAAEATPMTGAPPVTLTASAAATPG
jgi:hypothetical protein